MKMLRKVFAIVLALSLCLCLVPFSAFAAESYDLWIAGTQVTSDNCNDLATNGWSYDNATHTLTLKDFVGTTMNDDSSFILYDIPDAPLNIICEGNNTFDGQGVDQSMVIHIGGATPEDANDSVNISSKNGGTLVIQDCYYGISAYNISISDMDFHFTSGVCAFLSHNKVLIDDMAEIYIADSEYGVLMSDSGEADNGLFVIDSYLGVVAGAPVACGDFENTKIEFVDSPVYFVATNIDTPALFKNPTLDYKLDPTVGVGEGIGPLELITDLSTDYYNNAAIEITPVLILDKIPFKKIVKGNGAPAQDFELEIDYDYSDLQIDIPELDESMIFVESAISTNGAGTYEGVLKIYVPDEYWEVLDEYGFIVREKNTGAKDWTYSTEEYYAIYNNDEGIFEIFDPTTVNFDAFSAIDADVDPFENAKEFDEMTFTNIYVAPPVADKPAEQIADTADSNDVALYAMLTACFGGAALVVSKRSKFEA